MNTLLPLSLDYRRQRRAASRLDRALLIGALALTTYSGVLYLDLAGATAALEETQAAERASTHGTRERRLSPGDAQQLKNEVQQANAVLAQLALPWDALFADLDASQHERVALLLIEPDSEKRVVKVTGEARDFAAMLAYVNYLQDRPSLSGVYLQNHHMEQQSAEHPVRFSLLASWVIKP
jgi:Tfp pilus assembly protein PilN